jgi:hypothetical protein
LVSFAAASVAIETKFQGLALNTEKEVKNEKESIFDSTSGNFANRNDVCS